jgi:hypothetical protein
MRFTTELTEDTEEKRRKEIDCEEIHLRCASAEWGHCFVPFFPLSIRYPGR